MNSRKPEYHLRRVEPDDATRPELYRCTGAHSAIGSSRRRFLGQGLGIGAALAFLTRARAQAAMEVVSYAHSDEVLALVVTPDSRLLASASVDQTIKLWSLPDGRLLKTLTGHSNRVLSLAVTPDGKVLASGSADNTLILWSLPDGQLVKTLRDHSHWVSSLAVTPDGSILASGSWDKTIRLWSLPDGRSLATLRTSTDGVHPFYVYSLAVTPDGRHLISGSAERTIKVWSLADQRVIRTLVGHGSDVMAVAVTPDGRLIASASFDTVKLWAFGEDQPLRTLTGHGDLVPVLALTPDGQLLASAGSDRKVKLWLLEPVGRLRIAPDAGAVGSRRVSLSWDGHGTLEQGESAEGPWTVAPDQTQPHSLGTDGDRKFFRLRGQSTLPEGSMVQALTGHPWNTPTNASNGIECLAVSPDGALLFSGDSAGSIAVWNLTDRRLRGFLHDPASNFGKATSYDVLDSVTGHTISYTVPCGTSIPSNATCTCDCVQGTRPSGGGSCLCNLVCVCQAI